MSELGEVLARIARLSDVELLEVVREATADRPELQSLRTAAEALSQATAVDSEPDGTLPEVPSHEAPVVPDRPALPTTPDVAPPVGFTAAAARRPSLGERVDRMEELRESLKKTLKREM